MAGPVIITRAEPGNRETAARLEQAGLSHVCAPMLKIAPTGECLPPLEAVQGLLFTSANGVRAFCDVSPLRDIRAWCVGPATLAAAELAGFEICEHGDGNSDDLADLVIARARANAGSFVHIANEAAGGKLSGRLRAAGFEVVFAPLYAAHPAGELPEMAIEALAQITPCIVMSHSAKGAQAFARAVGRRDLSRHILVAVSEAAAAPLETAGFAAIICAERPNEASLMQALFRTYSTL